MPTTTGPTRLYSTDVDHAVTAITAALAALRADPASATVDLAIARATSAVDALDAGLTAEVLRRLVASIDECHRDGLPSSPRLVVRRRSASTALRLDPACSAGPRRRNGDR